MTSWAKSLGGGGVHTAAYRISEIYPLDVYPKKKKKMQAEPRKFS